MHSEMMDSKKVAEYLHCPVRKVNLLRKYGILKSVRFGKGYSYREEWITEMLELWNGYDLSNENAIIASVQRKRKEMSR